MNHLNQAHKNGGWVLLQNIHLTIDWTSGPLEKRIDKLADGAHPDFRCVPDWSSGSDFICCAMQMLHPSFPIPTAAGCSSRRRRLPRWSAHCPCLSCRPPFCSPTSRPRA